MEWRDIESAPDETDVLLLDADKNIRIGSKLKHSNIFKSELDFGDFYSSSFYPKYNQPTHWQPLPEPPKE